MFNSTILDVAIGLVFVYFLLAMVCTALNEVVESILKRRAKTLERGIREILGGRGDLTPVKKTLVEAFYNHPLVGNLFEGKYVAKEGGAMNMFGGNLPSYIPSRNFALTLMDLVLPADGSVSAVAPPNAANLVSAQRSGACGAMAPAIPPMAGATAIQTLPPPKAFEDLRTAVTHIQVEPLKHALLPLIDASGGDVAKARKNIEDWFDGSMDRVSGWYKRHAQWVTLVLALSITLLMNVDSILIAKTLSHDPQLRKVIADAAAAKAETAGGKTPEPSKPSDPGAPLTGAAGAQDAAASKATADDLANANKRLEDAVAEVDKLSLPIGWDTDDPRLYPKDGNWFPKVKGWLLTIVAVSLGAPFWFDVLNKIMVVRSTVKPKEKSPNEPPVDGPKK